MNMRFLSSVQVAMLFGIIVLPQVERTEVLDEGIVRGRLVENVYITAYAAERYAENRGGLYPSVVGSFAFLLPDERNLMNAVHGQRTEPVDGMAAAPGAVGFMPIAMGAYNVGYTITAFGANNSEGLNGDGIMLMIQKITDPPPPRK